jgi:hypothetical protein
MISSNEWFRLESCNTSLSACSLTLEKKQSLQAPLPFLPCLVGVAFSAAQAKSASDRTMTTKDVLEGIYDRI